MPFIDPADKIIEFDEKKDRGFYFGPLYKRMFCINEPRIFFIGLVEKLPLIHPTYERQVLLAKEVIEGKLKLPSKADMMTDLEKELADNEKSGNDRSKFYKFSKTGYTYWDYNNEMEQITSMDVDTHNYEGKWKHP